MDIHTLRIRLEQYVSGTTLSLPSANDLESVELSQLISSNLLDSRLLIDNVQRIDSPDAITYSGASKLFIQKEGEFQQRELDIQAKFYIVNQTAQLLIIADPVPSDWKFPQSFSGLEQDILESVSLTWAAFVLTSIDTTEAPYGSISTGTNFRGTVALTGPFSEVRNLLVDPQQMILSGRIDLQPGKAPQMRLIAPGSGSTTIGPITITVGIELLSTYIIIHTSSGMVKEQLDVSANLITVCSFGNGIVQIPISMQLTPGNPGLLVFAISNASIPLPDWSVFSSITDGVNLGSLIPPKVPSGTALVIKQFEIAVNPDNLTIGSIVLDVLLDAPEWAIIPGGILSVSDLGVQFSIIPPLGSPADPTVIDGALYGRFRIAENTYFNIQLDIPSLQLTAVLESGSTIPASDLLQQFISKATGGTIDLPIPNMTVSALSMLASPFTKEYSLSAEIDQGWEIDLAPLPVINLLTLDLNIVYTGSGLSGDITSYMEIGDVAFFASAAKEGGEAGWLLSMGTVLGSSIDILKIIHSFFNPSFERPGFLPESLKLTDVAISLNSSTLDYTIQAATDGFWEFEIRDVRFGLRGALHIESTKVQVPGGGMVRQLSGSLSGEFSLYGLLMGATYEFSGNNKTLTFSIQYNERSLTAALTSGIDSEDKPFSIATFRLGDLTIGEILEYLVNLAVPDLDFELEAPWNLLNQINLRNLALVVHLKPEKKITVTYDVNTNLGFVDISTIGLTYEKIKGKGQVKLAITGRFLDKEYDSSKPLEWDVANDPPPSVPAKGPAMLDIRYLGLGQHVSFSDTSQVNSVGDAIEMFKREMTPVTDPTANPLGAKNHSAMRFDRTSTFLLGLEMELMKMISLDLVFNDPYLYGILIQLSGERAKSLAGLRFELLYKRITDDIGVFKIELRVPDAFRQLEFGAVSITLPVIKVDIYTNGNFKVDMGFPRNGNFADSFCIQMFPFVGYGGFYFALLNGATSERVPKILNGEFAPVIEFGIALSVGLGKTFRAGPLSGGVYVTLYGALEGTVAWFSPTDSAAAKGVYYWIQGTVGIIGKLYGEIDFKIIQVSVSVEARAFATLIIEAYQPIAVALLLEVEAKASIKIIFVRITFTFHLSLSLSFTIGSRSTPPWTLDPAAPPVNRRLAAAGAEPAGQPQLRMQRNHYRARRPATWMLREIYSTPSVALRATTEAPPLDWTPVPVFDQIQDIPLSLLPGFTAAIADDGVENRVVLALYTRNSIDVAAREFDEVATPTGGLSSHATAAGEMPFNLLVRGMLAWAIDALMGAATGITVTAGDLRQLYAELERSDTENTGFTYENLAAFIKLNYQLHISGIPLNLEDAEPVPGTIFPMIPALSYSTSTRPTLSFDSYNMVGSGYEESIRAYYEQLKVDFDAGRASDPLAPEQVEERTCGGGDTDTESLATVIFRDYFLMLAKAAVQGAIDLSERFRYILGENDSLASIAAQFLPAVTTRVVRAGDTVDLICDEFGMTRQRLDELNGHHVTDPLTPGEVLRVEISVTPESVARDNRDTPLAAGRQLVLTGLRYQVKEAESIDDITARFGLAEAKELFTGAGSPNAENPLLLRPGRTICVAQPCDQGNHACFTYVSAPGDDLDLIAAWTYVRNGDSLDETRLVWYAQTIVNLNEMIDLSGAIPPGTPLGVPASFGDSETFINYLSRQGDTLPLVAGYFMAIQSEPPIIAPLADNIRALNPGIIDWDNLPPGTPVKIPAQNHVIMSGETLASLATLFLLDPADFMSPANTASTKLLAPLAVLRLPDVSYTTASDDTLGALASRFNLTVEELAGDAAFVTGFFDWEPAPAYLTITNVPAFDVDELLVQVIEQGAGNLAAGMVSRFLAHGLRLPSPDDNDFLALTCEQLRDGMAAEMTLSGIYDLTGQQFPLPADTTFPYDITVKKNPAVMWIEFEESLIVDESDTAESLRMRYPEIEGLNPQIDLDNDLHTGLHLLAEGLNDLMLRITEEMVEEQAPATTFDPQILDGPSPLRLYNLEPRKYTLPQSIHWQAAEPPAIYAATDAPVTGEPTIWTFTGELLDRIAADDSGEIPLGLFTASDGDRPGDGPPPAKYYAWGTMVDIEVRQINSIAANGAPLPRTCELAGADQNGRATLLELLTYLEGTGSTDTATIHLLYTPNAGGNNGRGLASQKLRGDKTFILKTNLSTLTTSNALEGTVGAGDEYTAALSDAPAFLELLWQGSITGTGGYILQYETDDDAGLPNELFSTDTAGTLTLLVLLASQTGPLLDRRARGFNNCAVVLDNIDPAVTNVFAEVVLPGTIELVKTASVPQGNIGFELARMNPEYETPESAEQRTRLLYSLLGFQVREGGGFIASHQGLPADPTEPKGTAAEYLAGLALGVPPEETWYYNQVFAVAPLAQEHPLPDVPGLPDPARDPYAGIAPGARATLALAFHDIYGNSITDPAAAMPVHADIGYIDTVIAPAQWPALSSSYLVSLDTGTGRAEITMTSALQAGTYFPASGNGFDAAVLSASAHLERYRRIYYQIRQDDVALAITTSLDQLPENPPRPYPVEKAPLTDLASAACIFLGAAARQKRATYLVAPTETLDSIAASRRGTAGEIDDLIIALGDANGAMPTDQIFSSPTGVRIPRYYTVRFGDTLKTIDAGNEVALATNNSTVPLNAGTDIIAPARTYTVADPADTFQRIAETMNCTVDGLAEANKDRRGILVEGTPLTVQGLTLLVRATALPPETESLDELAARFVAGNVLIDAAGVAAANATVEGIFIDATMLDVTDYVIVAKDTFASLAAAYPEFTIPALAEAAKESPNIFPDGTSLFLGEKGTRPLSPADTLDSIATLEGIALDQLTLFNRATPLLAGAELTYPWAMTIAPDDPDVLVPYYSPDGGTLGTAAMLFPETIDSFAERNRNMPGVFIPGVPVTVGTATEFTRATDSLGSLFDRLHADDPSITFNSYITQIAQRIGLLRKNALFVALLPSTNTSPTLDELAARFNIPAEAIGAVNGALVGFLRPGGTISMTYGGLLTELTVEQGDTFAALAARFARLLDMPVSVADVVRQNTARTGLVAEEIRFILPPAEARLAVRFDPGYPAAPNLPGTIFRMVTELAIERDPALVAPDFADVPEVRRAVSQIAPEARAGAGASLSLGYFAEKFEEAFPRLKAATGEIEAEPETGTGSREIWGVDFGADGIRDVGIAGNEPSFFALRPLANTLISRQEIPIRTFDPMSGTLEPETDPVKLNFQGIDLEVWAAIFLEAVELFLSPEYAVAACALNEEYFRRAVDAKRVLAAKIAEGVENVLAQARPEAVLANARERMRQELLIDLSRAYAVNTIVQYPVSVDSPFAGPGYTAADAPRLSGKPLNTVYVTGSTDDFGTIAARFGVAPVAVALVLRDMLRILNVGATVTYGGVHTHVIESGDTIETLRAIFGASDMQALVDNLSAPHGLFLPETPVNIYRVSTVAGDTASDPGAVTFATLSAYFDAALEEIIPSMQEKTGIFLIGAHNIDGHMVEVTPANNSIVLLANDYPVLGTPLELARRAEATKGLIDPAFRADVIRLLPEGNLSSAKTILFDGDTTLNILFNVKAPAERKRIFMDLEYVINELEFDIRTVHEVQGYQASSWLSFIRPIRPGSGELPNVETALGQVEIPIPLRAYPPLPLLVAQSGLPSVAKPTTVQEAILWDYLFDYEHQDAAQDDIYLHVTFNAPEDAALGGGTFDDFFAALAQFVSAYPAVKSKLNELLISDDDLMKTTIKTFVEMVEAVAESWQYDPARYLSGPGLAAGSLTADEYDYAVGFTVLREGDVDLLESLTLRLVPGPDGQLPPNPSPTGSFPDVFWLTPAGEWAKLVKRANDANEQIYDYGAEKPAAFTPIRHRIAFRDLDILTIRNGVAGTHVERNHDLVNGSATALWFTFSTPAINFPNVLTPLVEHSGVIRFGDGNLLQSLIALFDTELGLGTSSIFDVAVQFGYALVPSPAPGIDPIISRLPVAFQPWIMYNAGFPAKLFGVIQAWEQGKPLDPGAGIYVLDLTIYSGLSAAGNVPVLHLKELVNGPLAYTGD